MTVTSEITVEERASLQRLLTSDRMYRAPRLRSVLQFIIASLLEGRAEDVNEQTIGEAVFGRPPGYNPAEDNIVRVSIRHLRIRLDHFYAEEGKDEPWILEIPKGRYTPVLRPRLQEELSFPETLLNPAPDSTGTTQRFLATAPWILAAILALACAVLSYRLHQVTPLIAGH